MLYSSLIFIYGFFPPSLLIYRIFSEKLRKTVLFALSMIFCLLCSPEMLVFLIFFTFVNYVVGLFTGAFRRKKLLSTLCLFIGVAFDLVMFFTFRTEKFIFLKERLRIPDEIFPIYFSFITLSALGYLIDIYKKRIRAEGNFINFGLYIMMFSKFFIVIRYSSFRKMLDGLSCDNSQMGKGLKIFVRGLVRKVIFADSLYMLYIAVKSINVLEMSVANAWLGMTAYVLCLYFTLSGLTEMSTGISCCFGMEFPPCFNYPVFSTKIRTFVSKWHIQVLQWFRRCLLKPLCDLSKNRLCHRLAYILTWCAIGTWYRTDVNGLIFGGLLGFFLMEEKFLCRLRLLKATGIIYTCMAILMFAVLISGDDISCSFRYILAMLGGNGVFADSMTLYLLRCYGVILMAGVFFSSMIFRNIAVRCGKTVADIISPVLTVVFLAVCTALISGSGHSAVLILNF
ncbi:MAG: hypothetical protein K2J08_08650 [Ruminococcus sp.]|nr:hypothetical protein [Ruminococcus sp.]